MTKAACSCSDTYTCSKIFNIDALTARTPPSGPTALYVTLVLEDPLAVHGISVASDKAATAAIGSYPIETQDSRNETLPSRAARAFSGTSNDVLSHDYQVLEPDDTPWRLECIPKIDEEAGRLSPEEAYDLATEALDRFEAQWLAYRREEAKLLNSLDE